MVFQHHKELLFSRESKLTKAQNQLRARINFSITIFQVKKVKKERKGMFHTIQLHCCGVNGTGLFSQAKLNFTKPCLIGCISLTDCVDFVCRYITEPIGSPTSAAML